VTVWKNKNRAVISDNWLENEKELPKRFKEYAQFETERIKHNKAYPQKELSQQKYLEQNTRKYPDLAPSKKENTYQPRTYAPTKPDIKVSPRSKDIKVPPRDNNVKVTPQKQVPTKKEERIITPRRQTNEGREYHKNSWEQSKSSKQKIVKPAPPKQTVTQKKTIRKKN
jgi:hypothetical protein